MTAGGEGEKEKKNGKKKRIFERNFLRMGEYKYFVVF